MAEQNTPGAGPGETGAGGGNEGFVGTLSEELRGNEAFKGIESADQLGQSFVDLSSKHSELLSSLPKVPESMEGYTFKFPEGTEVAEENVGAFKDLAFKHKLSPEAFEAIMQFDIDRQKQVLEDYNKSVEADKEAVKKKMVEDMGDQYDANLQLAQAVLKAGEADGMEADFPLGNHPKFFQFLVKIGSMISEGRLETPGAGSGEGGTPPDEHADKLFGDMVKK